MTQCPFCGDDRADADSPCICIELIVSHVEEVVDKNLWGMGGIDYFLDFCELEPAQKEWASNNLEVVVQRRSLYRRIDGSKT